MTEAEQENCKFEPATASLKPQLIRNPEIEKIINAESDHTTYFNKHGENFTKTHPEVFKSGKLKKAKLLAKEGSYDKALSTLGEGFNLTSLQAKFDPSYFTKKKFIKDAMDRIKEKRENSVGATESKKANDASIAHMKEDVKDKQKEMPSEDFENLKLLPILREAYDLFHMLDSRKSEAEKKIKDIEKAKKKLIETKKQTEKRMFMDEIESKTSFMFKTIMCPLGDACPKVKKARWPSSSIKSVTKFGALCPYAHHLMELEFPATLETKINASESI